MTTGTEELFDTQAETSLISTLFFHPDFALYSEYLKAKNFYNKENGCIYWAINELLNKGINQRRSNKFSVAAFLSCILICDML